MILSNTEEVLKCGVRDIIVLYRYKAYIFLVLSKLTEDIITSVATGLLEATILLINRQLLQRSGN